MKLKIIAVLVVIAQTLGWATWAQTNDPDHVTTIPISGIETPVSALMAKPREYLGKPVIISGCVQVDNYYNYGYENASKTHFSLRFGELTKDVKVTSQLTVYAKRDLAGPLIDDIIKVQRGGGSKAVRLMVMITQRSFSDGEFGENVELVDWQYLNRATGQWAEWAHKPPLPPSPAEIAAAQAAAEAKSQAKARAEEARHAASKQATLKFYQSKAEAGEGFAQLRLGEIYLHGEGVETNCTLARQWLTTALTNGYPQATNLLDEIERSPAQR
jgi:hypothetical protein